MQERRGGEFYTPQQVSKLLAHLCLDNFNGKPKNAYDPACGSSSLLLQVGKIFKKQYNNSIANSALVVVASTVLTDMASRILSGMPSKKMSKEGLEQYQKDHKEGVMAWYYKAIDKLAS